MRPALHEQLSHRAGGLGAGVYAAVLSVVVLAVCGLVGVWLRQPWLFPSLGPTVMLFFESPRNPSARPKNALVGHLVGIAVGWAMLHAFDLATVPPAPVGGLTGRHVLAGALSVAVTSLILMSVRCAHPPAGATTLIVSLGIFRTIPQLTVMLLAVVLVTTLGWTLNTLLGEPVRREQDGSAGTARS
jgi:CBS-domain-containing membrane protein